MTGVASAALTPGQYRTRATAICKATTSWLNAHQPPAEHLDKAAALGNMKKLVTVLQSQRSALRKLDPPRSFLPLHLKILAVEQQHIDRIERLIAQIAATDDRRRS
jgi:hypothetical protein